MRNRKPARYGTKGYARNALLQAMRNWAKERRKVFNKQLLSQRIYHDDQKFAEALGVVSALRQTGLMTPAMDALWERHFAKINRTGNVWRRPGKGKQPWFELRFEGSEYRHRYPLDEMLADNRDDEDLCAWLQRAAPGETFEAGGGAAQASTVRRLS